MQYSLIVVGCSLGGLKALQQMLPGLSAAFPTPVIIVQHRDRDSNTSGLFGQILQKSSALTIAEAEDKMPIESGRIYLAPADYHLLIEDNYLELSTEMPVAHARPSLDVTFESAARRYGPSAVGVIMTGTGTDGASGVAEIERRGGLAIVQDPTSAEQGSMPRAAIAATRRAKVLSLDAIAPYLCSLVKGGEYGDGYRAAR